MNDALEWLRGALLRIWRARGGGFYGLGYLFTFVIMEVRLVTGGVASEGVADFVTGQLVERVLRFGVDSFLNSMLAFLWPAFVLQHLGLWGIVLLVGGYFGFEKLVRPWIERAVPELAADPEPPPENAKNGS